MRNISQMAAGPEQILLSDLAFVVMTVRVVLKSECEVAT
jgi:hypothetical protein